MSIEYLKRGKSEAAKNEEDAKTAAIVSATLKDIEARGDTAVRELSNKFDGYDRESYRLSEAEIEAIVAKVSPEDMADIRFAQEQVRNFAQAQRDSMLDVEVETLPGVILGHKNIPVQSVGCYVPVMWPGVITTGLFSFLLAYNDFAVTSMLLSQENQTMVPRIEAFLGSTFEEGNVMFAVAAVVSATAPLFVLVMFFQRQIVSGLTAGAVKG